MDFQFAALLAVLTAFGLAISLRQLARQEASVVLIPAVARPYDWAADGDL